MKVSIFGSGYVGLVQASVFADAGHDIICVDIDSNRIEGLKQNDIPIFEPGLETLVRENQLAGRLTFTTDSEFAVKSSDIIFIAVGTPADEDGSADLSYVLQVAETIAGHLDAYKLIVDKSTVPVGTADRVGHCIRGVLAQRGLSIDFDVVSNPEFLKEGAAIEDCKNPDRIVIGTSSKRAEQTMRELYAPFNRDHERIIAMSVRSAELTKYAANCMLATKISFMNEMANLAERLGADIEEVRQGIGSDSRIGYSFIYPGAGYGGSCFPKDVKALVNTAQTLGYTSQILDAVEAVNNYQKAHLLSLIDRHYGESTISGKTIALWGLSFKPQTDDMREATSRVIMEGLWQRGAKIQAYDPEAMAESKRIYGERTDLSYFNAKEEALVGADALVICTEWMHFRAPDFENMYQQLADKSVFDGRNIYAPDKMAQMSFHYYGIGRGKSLARMD